MKKLLYIIIGGIIIFIIILVTIGSSGEKKETELTQQPENSETSEQTEEINIFVENHDNIPLPNGAILKKYSPYQPETSTTAQQDESFTYEVNLSQEEVIKFYKENLPRFNWETDYIEKNMMFFKSNKELLFVGVDKKSQNESILTIMIEK